MNGKRTFFNIKISYFCTHIPGNSVFEIIIAIKHIDNMYPSKIDTNRIFMFKILSVQGYDQI